MKRAFFFLPFFLFAINLGLPSGFFVDEFDYFQAQGGVSWNGNLDRLPLVPFIASNLVLFFGLEAGIFASKLIAFGVAMLGVWLVCRELLPDERAFYAFGVVGTWFDFVFYSGKVLSDVFLVGLVCLAAWLALRAAREDGFNTPWLVALFVVLSAGVLTKATFFALFPLLALALLFWVYSAWFAGVVGFGWIALIFLAGLGFSGGVERYVLPALPFVVIFFFCFVRNKAAFWLAYSLVLLNCILFVGLAVQENAKFLEFEEARDSINLTGRVYSLLPKYAAFYWPEVESLNLPCEDLRKVKAPAFVVLSERYFYLGEDDCVNNARKLFGSKAGLVFSTKFLEVYKFEENETQKN